MYMYQYYSALYIAIHVICTQSLTQLWGKKFTPDSHHACVLHVDLVSQTLIEKPHDRKHDGWTGNR